eukprot:CAMPEP_0197533542 /NCGR_PEP_ID=MMETSP1318-20131121/43840_1 /TAXON_ID=552666 /ORGANISM="Partenskyella glossopodia, Strain RCC365" /LENGTH=207 /DNA_ID=CAMNT_0043090477 /DNA_START=275 /DNA_END=898 /DNA_ORIENTATION=+
MRECDEYKKKSVCFGCGVKGHLQSECPNKEDTSDGTKTTTSKERKCYNCGGFGHISKVCPSQRRRRFGRTKPVTERKRVSLFQKLEASPYGAAESKSNRDQIIAVDSSKGSSVSLSGASKQPVATISVQVGKASQNKSDSSDRAKSGKRKKRNSGSKNDKAQRRRQRRKKQQQQQQAEPGGGGGSNDNNNALQLLGLSYNSDSSGNE